MSDFMMALGNALAIVVGVLIGSLLAFREQPPNTAVFNREALTNRDNQQEGPR